MLASGFDSLDGNGGMAVLRPPSEALAQPKEITEKK